MNVDTIIIIITLIAMLFTILAFISNQSKKIDNLNKELVDFKVETSTRLSKIETKLDISDIQYHSTNETIKSNNQNTIQRIDKLEIDYKELKDYLNKMFDKMPQKHII